MENKKPPKKTKKKSTRLILAIALSLWLLVGIMVFMLLLAKPEGYSPQKIDKDKVVSQYVTNELAPYVYNNIQKGGQFDVIIPQSKTKEFIGLTEWPIESEGTSISAPEAFFLEQALAVRACATAKGLDFVVTLMISGFIDEKGLMHLNLEKAMIGSLNITLVAKIVGKIMYQQRVEENNYNTDAIGAHIAASLLDAKAFEPVFEVRGRKVRIVALKSSKGQLKITMQAVEN